MATKNVSQLLFRQWGVLLMHQTVPRDEVKSLTFQLHTLPTGQWQSLLPVIHRLHALCPGRVKVTIQDEPAQQDGREISLLLFVSPLRVAKAVYIGLVWQPHEEGVLSNLAQQSTLPDALLELAQQLQSATQGSFQPVFNPFLICANYLWHSWFIFHANLWHQHVSRVCDEYNGTQMTCQRQCFRSQMRQN